MVDRVKPLKFESAATGGTQEDEFPTSLDNNEDYVDVRGVAIQDNISEDENVIVSRDAVGNMTFIDISVGVTKTLTELLASGGVQVTGIPVDNQLAVWTGVNAIEGNPKLTWSTDTLFVGDTSPNEYISFTHDETDALISAGTGTIKFNDENLSAGLPLTESGVTGLVGYTAISIVGALNEAKVSSGGTIEEKGLLTTTGGLVYTPGGAGEVDLVVKD